VSVRETALDLEARDREPLAATARAPLQSVVTRLDTRDRVPIPAAIDEASEAVSHVEALHARQT
jgi:hypothetical protein